MVKSPKWMSGCGRNCRETRKLALALAVYCSLGAEKTTLTLRGWRDGEDKASIYDGNYMD